MIKLPDTEKQPLQFTGERYVPGTDPDSEALHYHRYLAAAALADGKDVLDIASGEGYGSWMLSQRARSVIGVERSGEAVSFARERYKCDNLKFEQGDCTDIPLEPSSVDVAVCFETIEHIVEQERLILELKRVLRPGGILLISTPEIDVYNRSQDTANPFHERELTKDEFQKLLKGHFSHVEIYEQGLKLSSVIWPPSKDPKSSSCQPLDFNLEPWIVKGDGEVTSKSTFPDAVILIGVASSADLQGRSIGSFFQCVPFPYPISAFQGGTEDRVAEASARIEQENQERITDLVREHGEKIADLVRERGERIADLVREHGEKIADLVRERGERIADLVREHGERIADLVAEARKSVRGRLLVPDVTDYDQGRPDKGYGIATLLRFAQRGGGFLTNSIENLVNKVYSKHKTGPVRETPRPELPLTAMESAVLKFGRSGALGEMCENPDVSIVIPVYNQFPYTRACLLSLAVHQTKYSFEVIVVDDGSRDGTEEAVSALPWVRYMRRPSNGGFIASCNDGLRTAAGRYVVFLNNDTEVLTGWLDELIGTFDIFPAAGLVGSRLLYPNGKQQESGGILWRDGSAWNYGHNQAPTDPQFSYARQVDYCSGASIALPRELMNSLGGFDTHFAPAYCEDSDLAMRVRQCGRTVMVQPLSYVIHYEGVTSGTDTSTGVKAYQVDNTRKLFERWRAELQSRPENAHNPTDAKDFGLQKRLLVIDAITPEPDRDAGSVTCFEIMKSAQSLGYQVTFIPYSNFADIPKYTANLQRHGIEALYGPYCRSVRDHLVKHGGRYAAIMVYRVGILSEIYADIRELAPHARLIYHTSDLHHLREQREAEVKKSASLAEQAAKTKQAELELVGKCDATIVHSSFEKTYLAEVVPTAHVEVFNWILDPRGTEVPFESRSGIMFLGGFSHQPNVDGVHWFLDEIWPTVTAALPGVTFYVVGSNLPPDLQARASENVRMVGYVEELAPMMNVCRMSVAPLRFGAGTKGKVAMSLAHGLPVVTTSIGAEGMGLVDGLSAEIADSADDFARKVVELHGNRSLWDRMSAEGLAYVTSNLSRDAGTRIIRAVLSPGHLFS